MSDEYVKQRQENDKQISKLKEELLEQEHFREDRRVSYENKIEESQDRSNDIRDEIYLLEESNEKLTKKIESKKKIRRSLQNNKSPPSAREPRTAQSNKGKSARHELPDPKELYKDDNNENKPAPNLAKDAGPGDLLQNFQPMALQHSNMAASGFASHPGAQCFQNQHYPALYPAAGMIPAAINPSLVGYPGQMLSPQGVGYSLPPHFVPHGQVPHFQQVPNQLPTQVSIPNDRQWSAKDDASLVSQITDSTRKRDKRKLASKDKFDINEIRYHSKLHNPKDIEALESFDACKDKLSKLGDYGLKRHSFHSQIQLDGIPFVQHDAYNDYFRRSGAPFPNRRSMSHSNKEKAKKKSHDDFVWIGIPS